MSQNKNNLYYFIEKFSNKKLKEADKLKVERFLEEISIEKANKNLEKINEKEKYLDFKESSSLKRKKKLIEEAKINDLSLSKITTGEITLKEDKNFIKPQNFSKNEAILKMIQPYKNAKGKKLIPQRHITIIGLYILAKKTKIESEEQLNKIISRNLREAKELKIYPYNKIIKTLNFLVEKAEYKWTLETVSKFIDEDLTNNFKKNKNNKILGDIPIS